MFNPNLKHRTILFFKQIERAYIVSKNNKAVREAFLYGVETPPFTRANTFTQKHFLFPTILITSLTFISLMVFFKPTSFSKQVPNNVGIENKIQKRLVNLQPAPKVDISIKKETPKKIVEFEPVMPKTEISRKTFMKKAAGHILILNKFTKKLFVTKETENGYSVVKEFPVSLGKMPGDKKLQGDNKTPEGIYTLIDLRTDEELPDKYGPFAAVLNYPNKEDLKQGKTGTGIWIHGTGNNTLTPDTQGCIELNDNNLIQLFSYIGKGVKIIILPEKIDISPKRKIIQEDLMKLAAIS